MCTLNHVRTPAANVDVISVCLLAQKTMSGASYKNEMIKREVMKMHVN